MGSHAARITARTRIDLDKLDNCGIHHKDQPVNLTAEYYSQMMVSADVSPTHHSSIPRSERDPARLGFE
jgi:hypothetical protein